MPDGRKNKEKNALTENQVKAVRLYMTSNMTQEQVSTAVGVTRETVCRWFKQPNVKQYMEEIREVIETEGEEYIIKLFEDIRNDLYKMFKDPSESTGNKVKIADLLFKSAGLYKQKVEISANETREKLDEWLNDDDEDVKKLIESSFEEPDELN